MHRSASILRTLALFAVLAVASVAQAVSTTMVISQFQVAGGTAADEFVELHNVSGSPIDLNGYRVVYRSAAGVSDVAVINWTTTTTVPAGGYYLIVHATGYDNGVTVPGDITFPGGGTGTFAAAGGGFALRQGAANTGTIIDSVGYGTATNAFVESTVEPAPAANQSAARLNSGCTDTDNNANDFAVLNPAVPRNSGTTAFLCAPPLPSLTIDNVGVTEGNAGTVAAIFTVQLSAPAGPGGVTFDIATADGTATIADNDYVTKSLTGETIAAGNNSYSFTVDVNGDVAIENTETFFVNVTNVVGATVGDGQGQGTITNDDSPTLSIDDVSLNETDAGTTTFTFTVSLSQAAGAGGVTFDVATADGTATAGTDYVEITTTPMTITVGNTSAVVNVTVNGDTTFEPGETFLVNITNVTGATVNDGQGQGTIVNDDISVSINSVSKAEGNAGTTIYNFVVTFSEAPGARTVTFDIATADVTATAGTDYVANAATGVSLTGATTTYAFDVTANGDGTFEPTETFAVNVTNITGGSAPDGTTSTSGTGTITNDDAAPTFAIDDVKVIEGNAGTSLMTFTVTLASASTNPSSVDYLTSDISATVADSDYVTASGTLNFAAGDVSETFTVTINGDTNIEGDEDFLVTLSNPVGATIADSTGLGVIGIDDAFSIAAVNTPFTQNFDVLSADDTAGVRAATTPAAWTFDENGTGVNVTYRPSDGSSNTGNAGDTYSLGSTGSSDRAFGALASNAVQATLGGYFRNDTGETITTLSIAYTGEQWRLGTADAIADRLDFAYSTDATTLDSGTWTEVNSLDFTSPTATPAGPLDGNAVANRTPVGYTIAGLSLAPGATIWLRWVDPNISGNDDSLGIDDFSIIANIAGGVLTIDDVTLVEGDGVGTVNFVFTVSLTQPAGPGGVSFDITTADNTATAGSDYVTNTLTGQVIPEGQSTYQFTVVVNSDDTEEPSETFFVNVTNVGGATLSDGQGIGTIASDDFTFTRIHTIQGSGLQSPLNGSTVTVEGIVTGIKSGGSGGFFVQEQVADYDVDPLTSEGIFVFTGGSNPPSVVIGNLVAVTGTVSEFPSSANPHTVTELAGTVSVDLLSGVQQPLPAAVVLTTADGAPSSNLSQYEAYEGMRVSATLTVVAPTDGSIDENDATSSSNGVFYGVIAGNPRPFREPGIEQTYTIPPEAACAACIDRFDENPEKIRVDSDNQPGATQLNVVAGQTVSNLVGPLDYGFFEYTLLPEAETVPIVSGDSTADPVPTPLLTELTVAGFNLFHFFDNADDPDVSDVVLTVTAYNNRLNKASLAIRNILQTPDVIGVIEVDNVNTLQALATKINTDTAGVTNYFAYLEEGNDVGGIDVGFLVDLNRVTVQAVTQIGKDTTWINPHTGLQDSSELNDRPSLVLEASIVRPDLTQYEFVVIVNHLRSLIGIEEDSSGGRRVRAKRAAQAEFLASYVQGRQVADPTERIILVGDFNAFEVNDGFVDVMGTIKGSPAPATEVVEPTDDLVNPNLTNLIETLPADQRYTYVFDGNAQAIDHALVNAAMLPSVSQFVVAHLDADFPVIFYGDSARPERLADHDATVSYFDLTPLPQISIGDTSVTEGQSGTTVMTFTVTLSDPAATTVTVDYTTANGTATAGSDYTAESGTVTFVPGDQSETITIDVSGDLLLETDETLTVTLSNASVTAMINDGTATGTILNDDVPSGISIADNSVAEGNSGTTPLTFTVTLANPVPQTVTVDYTTSNGTATAGSDYVAESGTITFLANDQSETITIDVNGDLLLESDETFTITLSNPSPTATLTDGSATGTITNDDVASGIVIGDVSQAEGNAGTTAMTFTVTLANPVPEPVVLNYTTSNGTAIAGTDYVAESGTITFVANDQSETITIDINGDTDFEADETFTVTLSNAPPTTVINDGTATGTILNDDVPSGMFISDSSATETNAGTTTMTFTVSLANPVGSTVTVDYTTSDGTATAGSDYVAQSGTLTFVAGDQSEQIVITVNGDVMFEADETFTVTLSNATATTTISDATATGTIINDDGAVADLTLTMSSSPANPAPGTNVTYTLVVTNNGPQPATGVVVTDDLPDGMAFVSANTTQGTCTGTDPVQCNVGILGVGQSATITIVAQLPSNPGGAYVNTATADANENDTTAAAATVTITFPSHGEAHIPTLSEWMLIMLALMLAALAAAKLKM